MGNEIDKVCTGLYVGGLMGATNKETLKKNNITHILSLLDATEPAFPGEFTYKVIKVADSPTADLSKYFQECVDFIHGARTSGGSCYVHCAAGISRSTTTCIMYLMTVSTLCYEDAFTILQYARKQASPNFGFRMQLKRYSRTTLDKEREKIKQQPSNLNDEEELQDLLKTAKEHFAVVGQPYRHPDDDVYVDPDTLISKP